MEYFYEWQSASDVLTLDFQVQFVYLGLLLQLRVLGVLELRVHHAELHLLEHLRLVLLAHLVDLLLECEVLMLDILVGLQLHLEHLVRDLDRLQRI